MRVQDGWVRLGRFTFPAPLFAFPFYLWKRSPGKDGSHYDPKCDLFKENEAGMVHTSNAFLLGMTAILAAFTVALGPLAMFKLYLIPYWINVMWLDAVTYLHHHGTDDGSKMPWYRCFAPLYATRFLASGCHLVVTPASA